MPYRTPSPSPLRLTLAALTDVGPVRMHNEDEFLVFELDREVRFSTAPAFGDFDSNRGFGLAVIDGMGGSMSGEAATRMAVETIHGELTRERHVEGEACLRRLGEAMNAASAAIFQACARDRRLMGSGACATAAIVEGDRLHLAQVGDTRAYVLRLGRLTQVTRDHSLVNDALELGVPEDQIDALPTGIITRALGMKEAVDATLSTIELRDGDTLLLCSDGLNKDLADEGMEQILVALPHPAEAARALLDAAVRAGGSDNITAIVARVASDGLRPPTAADALENRNARRRKP